MMSLMLKNVCCAYRETVVKLCSLKSTQEFIREADFYVYQAIVELLLPDVLRPIPSNNELLKLCALT